MVEFLSFGLGAVAAAFIDYITAKVCDGGGQRLQQILDDAKLNSNHDIERTIFRAHVIALEFVINGAIRNHGLADRGANTWDALQKLKRLHRVAATSAPQGFASNLTDTWRETIQSTFPKVGTGQRRIEFEKYVDFAISDLRSLTRWSVTECAQVEAAAVDPAYGWAAVFKAKLHDALKQSGPFQSIYTQHVLKEQGDTLQDISDKLDAARELIAPSEELREWMVGINNQLSEIMTTTTGIQETTQRIEDLIGAFIAKNDLTNPKGEFSALKKQLDQLQNEKLLTASKLKRFLTVALPAVTITDGQISEKLEELFALVLKEREKYVERLNTQTNDPEEFRELRNAVAAFLEAYEYDAARAAVRAARKIDEGRIEQAARDMAFYDIEEARIDIIALRTAKGMKLFERAATILEPYDSVEAWAWLMEGADAGHKRSEISGDRQLMDFAINLYERSLALVSSNEENSIPKEGLSNEWATIKHMLGSALQTLGQRGDADAIPISIAALNDALNIWTRDASPHNWAAVKNSLGASLWVLGEWGSIKALEDVITIYEEILEVWTEHSSSVNWAMTQNNLGVAYYTIGSRDKVNKEALEKSIDAFNKALSVRTADQVPLDWATTQNNLGNSFMRLAEEGDDNALRNAITAYKDALTKRNRTNDPLDWAATKNNLGSALVLFGERHSDKALEEAITVLEEALEERPRDTLPFDWAATQHNLGNAHLALGRKGNAIAIKNAVIAFENALTERKQEKVPFAWATTQKSMAGALEELGELGDQSAWQRAIDACNSALRVCKRDIVPYKWAETKRRLGSILRTIGERGDGTALQEAIAAYGEALQVGTRDSDPQKWASFTNGLGCAYFALADRGDNCALNKAMDCFEAALQEWRRDEVPVKWAIAKNNLGEALLMRGIRGEHEALRNSIVLLNEALEVRTRDEAPHRWALTKTNLGRALQHLGEIESRHLLGMAIAAHEESLLELTREKFPLDWAAAKNNLGEALLASAHRGDTYKLPQAITAFEDSLNERTRDKVPLDWAVTTYNLGRADSSQGSKVQSQSYLNDALSVFRELNHPGYLAKVVGAMRALGHGLNS